jgi:hypothetical protein
MSTSLHTQHISETHREEPTMELRGGPGAPIFEPGPHTRIRRAPVRSIATMTWTNGPREIFGQVVNVSPSGCLVKTESTIPDGTQLEMSITILGEGRRTTIDACGIVVRQTSVDGRRAYGVEFRPENRADRESLQWLYAEATR